MISIQAVPLLVSSDFKQKKTFGCIQLEQMHGVHKCSSMTFYEFLVLLGFNVLI